ncbi:MAG: glycosyltransferase family 9 protein [Chloroflexi bacterium]|nr:glycosyltransferase family 9 protein [Chloroflexota bacterium]
MEVVSPPASAPHRILAIKLADLGDVLNITPALRALRHSFPRARLDVLLNPHTTALLQGSELIDHIMVFPKVQYEGNSVLWPWRWPGLGGYLGGLRQQRYDTVVDFHHLTTPLGRLKQRLLIAATGAKVTVGLDNGHGNWFTHPVPDRGFGIMPEGAYWLALAKRLGAESADTRLHLPVAPADAAAADRLLAEAGLVPGRFVVLHPGSGGFSLARRWEAAKFARLAAALWRQHDLAAVVVGSADDGADELLAEGSSPLIDFSQRTSLGQLAALLQRAALFVGADSGVMHMAAAMQTPVVAIFGPSNHLAWAPWTPTSRSEVVRLDISCSPCAYVGHGLGWRHGCPERTCLADLGVAQVLAAADRLLAPTPG